jgi:hypothetical protein
MISVSITRGCTQESAQQFVEGAETFARVCDTANSNLVVFSDENCVVVVKVEGEETLRAALEANQSYEFPCSTALKVKRSRSQIAKAGFLALFGAGKPAAAANTRPSAQAGDELAQAFVVEIRQAGAGNSLEGSYNFRLLEDSAFDQRFAGYLNDRVVEEPKPVFTRDARPIQCLANSSRCMACNTVISDCIAGCENGDCPTVAVTKKNK